MLIHPQFDPVAFAIGPVSVRWYGLMYLVGFAGFYLLARLRCKDAWRGMQVSELEVLLFFGILGVVIGGRLGFCCFYQPGYYIHHLLEVFAIWEGGMSVHGGMLGVAAAIAYFAFTRKKGFVKTADFVVPLVPVGLFFGRIGNFINGELWGRVTTPDFPLAMAFPQSGDMLPRHPSQLYEAVLEGLVMFCVLYALSRRRPARPQGTFMGTFLVLYGVFRFLVEFVRVPDAQLGYLFGPITMGQCLSLPLVVLGIVVLLLSRRLNRPQVGHLE